MWFLRRIFNIISIDDYQFVGRGIHRLPVGIFTRKELLSLISLQQLDIHDLENELQRLIYNPDDVKIDELEGELPF